VQRDQICDEDISAPRADHVAVEQGCESSPHDTPHLHGLDPEVEGVHQQEDGNGLVVIAPRYGTRDVAWRDSHEARCKQASGGRVGHLRGEEIGGESGEAGERRSKQNADVADVDGEGEEAEEVVDGSGGDHEAWVEGSAGDAAEGVPCS